MCHAERFLSAERAAPHAGRTTVVAWLYSLSARVLENTLHEALLTAPLHRATVGGELPGQPERKRD
jgi:hypothetical protein